jgi:hypothetical protein
MKYNQDFASNEFGNAFNRDTANKTNTYNRLAQISGTGQTSANQIATQGAQVANSVGNNIMGAGNARASGYIAQGNALTGALGQGVKAWQQQNALSNPYGQNLSNLSDSDFTGYSGAYDQNANSAFYNY